MSSLLSRQTVRLSLALSNLLLPCSRLNRLAGNIGAIVPIVLVLLLSACDFSQLNNPYPKEEGTLAVLYESFSERPKHLDPAVAYSSNEYAFIAQIYEPPFQYHYLKRPYQLSPFDSNRNAKDRLSE